MNWLRFVMAVLAALCLAQNVWARAWNWAAFALVVCLLWVWIIHREGQKVSR